MQELDDVLEAIFEHRRATAPSTDSTSADFADIRAAFASLRNALELPAGTSQPGSGNPEPGSAPAQPPTGRRDRPAPEADDFGDIRAAFTDLRRALDLPGYGPDPGTQDAGAASGRLLDQAAAETQACARWYQDTPEWQRITAVSHAARELITAIRQASGDYWAEIRQDIRVRGFTRTLAARTSLAISSTAHVLAGQLEEAGNKNTRIWQAVWGLHRATASFADQVMKYTPPRAPGRMDEVRRIINDLGKHPHRSREEHAASAAALAREGFPLRVPPTAIQSVTAPAAHAKPPQPRTARRP